jgi:hypothetical protein
MTEEPDFTTLMSSQGLPCECNVMYENEEAGVATAFSFVANDRYDWIARFKNT